MRTDWFHLDPYRLRFPEGTVMDKFNSARGETCGAFRIPVGNSILRIIASDGNYADAGLPVAHAWEHVSVSLEDRCPTWDEMCQIKDLFWEDDECVVQYHPPKSEYVNRHPYCLHLWRPLLENLPTPPKTVV
jgi:hypothetical protein